MEQRRAALYCRISRDPKEKRVGVEAQERDCRRFIASRGWETIEPAYVDNDVSAWSGKRRPAWERLRADVEAGRIGAVVVYRLSRLARDVTGQEAILRLFRAKHVLLATSDGEVEIGTADGVFMTRIQGAVNAHESDIISERVRRSLVTVAENGMPHGGQRPYGFLDRINDEGDNKRTVEHDLHEAAVIREVTDALLSGASIRSMCSRLNARGDLSVTGKPWEISSLSRMLLRPRIIGVRSHRATGNHPAAWNAIIEPEDQVRLRLILNDPRRKREGVPPRHLLSGILRCSKCGTRMSARPAFKSNRRSYGCPPKPRGCNGTGILMHEVDALVTEAVLQALDTNTFDLRPDGDTAEQYRARQVELAEIWADGRLTTEEYNAARKRLAARIAEVEARVVRSHERAALNKQRVGLRERWPAMTVEERRTVIDVVIEKIVVQPGSRGKAFDPARISVVWAV